MSGKRYKIISWCVVWWLLWIASGCQKTSENQLNNTKIEQPSSATPSPTPATAFNSAVVIDVPRFAGKSPAEFAQIFGQALDIKAVKGDARSGRESGEYRLYQTPNHPQGLSVHFYGGKALIFNLVLGEPTKRPEEAFSKYFAIDVKNAKPIEKTQFLEKWQGKFNGINFISVYAMKERIENDSYKLLHAEVSK